MAELNINCCFKCGDFNNGGACSTCYNRRFIRVERDEEAELYAELEQWRYKRATSQNLRFADDAGIKKRGGGSGVMMFYYCPKCKEKFKYAYWDSYKRYTSSDYGSGSGYMAKCPKCGYDESQNPLLQLSAKQRQKKDEKIIEEMVASCIPPPKTPKVYFSSSQYKADTGISCPTNPWAFASSDFNNIFFWAKLWNQPRISIADTAAHESGHLAPERGMTLEDAKEEGYHIPSETAYNEAENIEKTAPHSGWSLGQERLKKDLGLEGYGHKILPHHIYTQMKNGWPDNKIPAQRFNNWERKEFVGDTFEGGNWGAGGGHGAGWFRSYQNYKSLVFGKFSTWINDPSQPPARMYQPPTFSQEWFLLGANPRKNLDQVIQAKPHNAEIDKFGDKFFKADEDWNNYVKNYPTGD